MITSLYAGLFGALFMLMTSDVIKGRRAHKVSVGAGKNNEILQLTSAHANFSSYVPFIIMMLYLLESSGEIHRSIIHLLGFVTLLGRSFHYLAFRKKMIFRIRIAGMILTIFPIIIMSLLNIYLFLM